MKFGQITLEEQEHLDLKLPPDHPDTMKILPGKKASQVQVYCGCAKWARKEWVGMVYPEKTAQKDFLKQYTEVFNSVELNSTFYNLKRNSVESWLEQAPEGFKFCPKVSRRISHIKRLKVEDDFLDYFLTITRQMGDNLGMSFLQMPENFGSKWFDRLSDFLEHIPKDYPMALELRHEDWYNDSTTIDRTFDLLKKHNKSLVITDVGGRRDVLHMRLTSPEVFVRFNGYGLNKHTFRRLDDWVDRLDHWINNGLRTIYFYPHQQDETFTPISCNYFLKKLKDKTGLSIEVPQLLEDYKL